MTSIESRGLPAALECERIVLGICMAYPESLHEVRPLIDATDFTTEEHRRAWEVLTSLYDAGKATDRVSVYHEADRRRFNLTLSFLVDLDANVPRLPSIDAYVQILKDKTLLRQIITACRNMTARCLDGQETATEILEGFGKIAVDLIPKEAPGGLQSAKELIEEVGLERLLASRRDRGLPFPWSWLNYWTNGMLSAELWILAGHTSTGKTSAMLQHAVNAARKGYGVAIYSLEVGKESLFQKACYQLAMVDSEKGKNGELDEDERRRLMRAAHELNDLALYFDTTARTVPAIHASLRRRRIKNRVGHVIVDYLQLLGDSGRHDNRAQAVGANAWALKMLATDFQVPVLLLSQFSRPKDGGSKRPELSSLKESGDIENHANGVWFLNRPEQGDSDVISVDFMLPKQRDGRRNIAHPMVFLPKYQCFKEREE